MAYDTSKFNLIAQGIATDQQWFYSDTGGETAAGYSAAGFFTDAKDKGVDTGDVVIIRDVSGGKLYQGYMHAVQDTGSTSGSWKQDTG
jgi:hypothetical protein